MNSHINNLHTILTTVLTNEKKSKPKKPQKDQQSIISQKSMSIPNTETAADDLPSWQVRFEILGTHTADDICLEINEDIIFGTENGANNIINLLQYSNNILGVSHRHLQLSPSKNGLFITDLNSTNGTRQNGRAIQPNTPYLLSHGDILELGDLILAVNLEKTSSGVNNFTENEKSIGTALTHLSTLLTSGLCVDDVLNRIIQMASDLCHAEQVALFLRDEEALELHLKSERGMALEKAQLLRVPLDRGLPILEVLHTGEPMRCGGGNGHQYEVVPGYSVHTVLYMPIFVEGSVIGVLMAAQKNVQRDFTREDERTLCTLGKFTAMAIQNSQTYEATNLKLQRKIDELSLYNTISRELSKTNNLTGIYNALRNQVRGRWKADNIGLWLFEEATQNLVPFPRPSFHKTYSLGEEMIGQAASQAAPVLATNIKLFSEPTKTVEPTLQLLARSAACVPIIENNKVLGVLAAFSTHENEFDEKDIDLLQTFSQAASAAIRNAWLFEQVDKQRATILAAVNMLSQPMMIVDRDGKIIVSNKAADALLNEMHSSVGGTAGMQNGSCTTLSALMNGLAESKWRTKEIIVGERIYVVTLEYASMVGTVILMQDVTDPVTGTANQRHFHDLAKQAFQQAKRYSKPLAALVIGLDNLEKAMNGQGYTVRNQILKELASQLRGCLRTPDILGRYHENEFVVILPETNLENAQVVAERIIKSVSKKSFQMENYKFSPSLRVGVTTFDSNKDDSIDVLMEKAYKAFLSTTNNKRQMQVYKDI